MKNALKYGLIIGLASGVYILILHLTGAYDVHFPVSDSIAWYEGLSTIIPLLGVYFGVKSFRDNYNGGRMEFFEGMFEAIKIILVGGLIAAFFAVIYVAQITNTDKNMDIWGRIGAAGLVGIIFVLAIPLILMNKQRNL